MESTNDLVSVLVTTYNSVNTIIETLDSIKNQTYNNIELIISDDCSSDNSIKICEEWIKINADSFYKIRLITVPKNTGIPANANRCIKASQANWIKFIAGDDTLKIDCIQNNMNFILLHPEVEILQSLSDIYIDSFKSSNLQNSIPSLKNQSFFRLEVNAQYNYLKNVTNPVCAPSMFFRKRAIEKAGGFDERFTLMEDLPMWLNITKTGTKIHFLPVSTVNYRMHNKSVITEGQDKVSAKFARSYIFFFNTYYAPEERNFKIKKDIFKLRCWIFFDNIGLNNKTLLSRICYGLVERL